MKTLEHPADAEKSLSHHSGGFTLFEAIVAITLLGVSLVPILALLSQSASQLTRVGEANQRSFVRLSVLQVMEAVNPLEQPSGEIDLIGFRVSWQSTEVEAASPPEARTAGLRGYALGWFTMSVEVFDPQDRLIDSFTLEKTGYRRLNDQSPLSRPS